MWLTSSAGSKPKRTPAVKAASGAQAGALRNGAPFKDWLLPSAVVRVRRKLKGSDDGDRQMVEILSAVLTDGLQAVEATCAESLETGVASANVIFNALARRYSPEPAQPLPTSPIAEPADVAVDAHVLGCPAIRSHRPRREPHGSFRSTRAAASFPA